jgi:hypothetical protein
MLGHGEGALPDQHEAQAFGMALRVPDEVVEESRAALVRVEAADVHRERAPYVVLLAKPPGLRALGHFRSDADDRPGPGAAADGLDERAFLVRVVDDGAGAAKHRAEHGQPNRRIAFRRRHEHRAIRRGTRAVEGRVVPEAEEQEEIDVLPDRSDVAHETRTDGPLALQPA